MKIALFSRNSPITTGGVERFIGELRNALLARGHCCDVITGIDIGCGVDASVTAVARRMALFWNKIKNTYDIALFNGEYGYRVKGERIVNVFHGTSRGQVMATLAGSHLLGAVASFLIPGSMQWIAGLKHTRVAVSESARRDLRKWYWLSGAHVIQNGIDVVRFSSGEQKVARESLGLPIHGRIYLYSSRIEKGKCPEFLHVWATNLGVNEHLVVASNIKVNLPKSVTSFQNVSRDRMPFLYQAADAFLMPSHYEGCSYALIEAMSCSCLIVASPVGHAPDIIRSKPVLNDCFESRYDAVAFLTRARRLLDNPQLAENLRANARQYVLENNTLETMGAQYEAVFERIIRAIPVSCSDARYADKKRGDSLIVKNHSDIRQR